MSKTRAFYFDCTMVRNRPQTLLLLTLLITGFVACQKCYDCTTLNRVYFSDQQVNAALGQENSDTVEECGTSTDIAEYEENNTVSVTTNDPNWGEYTVSSSTQCVKQ